MKRKLIALGLVGIFATATHGLWAADHTDGPAAVADPSADIGDLYAWMNNDASKLNLITTVNPMAGASTKFSTATIYRFHVNSAAGYGMTQTETNVTCKFYDDTNIECWAGDEYAVGDPSAEAGLDSDGGKMKVFAGQRNDPFFFEFAGFGKAVDTVKAAAAGGIMFDADGCPAVDGPTSTALQNLLAGKEADGTGGPAVDAFAGTNVLALVVQIDKDVVNSGGDVLSVWASTHKAQ